jgi:hypothetical protein
MKRSKPILWPIAKLGDALSALAQQSGVALRAGERQGAVDQLLDCSDPRALGRWVQDSARQAGMEAERVDFLCRLAASRIECGARPHPTHAGR